MVEDLTVHVNRRRRHDIQVAGGPFETVGSFEVVLQNHGEGAHVHVGLEGDLAAAATVETPSPFLEADATERVIVSVSPRATERPVTGAVTVSTGYGQSSVEVPVSTVPPERTPVDAEPAPAESAPAFAAVADRLPAVGAALDPATLALAALAGGALLVALLAAWLVESAVVLAGVLVVVVAVASAAGLLLSS